MIVIFSCMNVDLIEVILWLQYKKKKNSSLMFFFTYVLSDKAWLEYCFCMDVYTFICRVNNEGF